MPQSPISTFEVVGECPQTRARAGILHTPHGSIETPAFMPVGTQATVKALTPKMLAEELGARLILGNTYHLYLRPGHETVAELGGLHRFMGWPGAILTDSGGFQVFSLSGLRKISERGVVFRSHLDGSEHLFTPESTVDVQLALGSDIQMTLDDCTPYPVSHEAARASMERTVRWAERAFSHWGRRPEGVSRGREGQPGSGGAPASFSAAANPPGAQLFPIVQGSMYPDLRRECAQRLLALDASGYAVGGLSVGEPRPLTYEVMEAVEDLLPRERPRYMMGVGMLHELGEYVARGVDMMDCVLPTRNARNGYLFTSTGRIVIKNTAWARDPRPVDEHCGCYTCRNFSRAYLRHLFLAREILYSTLATLHNVAIYLDRMRRIREAILIGNLAGFLARIRATHEADDQAD
ncbi:MAG: tRNA guanosine(34) transglycosylase Tgt [Bryobacterales bacterium]